MEELLLAAIQRLQQKPVYGQPEKTGHGVTVWALAGEFEHSHPKEIVAAAKSLAADGKIKVIDPDGQGFISFIAL